MNSTIKKIGLIVFVFFTFLSNILAQGSGVPLGSDTYHIMDRLEIKTGFATPFHSSLKYYSRGDVTRYAMTIDSQATNLSELDKADLNYIYRDNNEWLGLTQFPTTLTGPNETTTNQANKSLQSNHYQIRTKPILKYFYKTPANFFEVDKEFFHLKVNPIINFKLAKNQDDTQLIFLNQRGVEIRGGIDDRVFFYTNIVESQARFPQYVVDREKRDKALPSARFYKAYNSVVFDIDNGYDFLLSQGYLGFNATKHIGIQFGFGRNFIGNGIRSMILSDFASNYLYLKANTRIWKFHYQNIFAELLVESDRSDPIDRVLSKKYLAAHHLSFNITPKLNIGIFETIVFSRNNNFELHYLNPIILYRTVEGAIGSPDNALIGLDGKWNLFNKFQLYGQLMLDEFKFDELFIERRGWWANKFGIQAGLKYIDALGINHLDIQAEANIIRPFTYTHRDSSASYSHNNQPLAHPLGANLKEVILKLRYQPIHKLLFDTRMILMNYGEDTSTENWGNNILTSHNSRFQDFGNEIGQGIETTTIILGIDISYQIFHNGYIDLHYFYRKKDSDNNLLDKTTNYIGGGFRMNIGKMRMDF